MRIRIWCEVQGESGWGDRFTSWVCNCVTK